MPDQTTPVAATRQFAQFAAGLTYGRLPANVREVLTMFLLDYLRVASLGQRMPWSAWATNLGRELGGNGQATVMFTSDRTDPERATFINTTYSGSIDADDVHVGSMLHPGCIVISAALAIGEARGLSGERILAAIAAGYENMIRIGLAIQPYAVDWPWQVIAEVTLMDWAVPSGDWTETQRLNGRLAVLMRMEAARSKKTTPKL